MTEQAQEQDNANKKTKESREEDAKSIVQETPIQKNLWILVVGLLLGAFSIFSASAFRDFVYAIFEMSLPMSEKALQGGTALVLYRLFCFLIITSLFVIATVVIVSVTPVR